MVTKILGGRHRGPPKLYIQEWMAHRELTVEKLAGRVEVERNTIYRWIKGERWPRPEYYDPLVEALELDFFADLYRPPSRPSIDAITSKLPDEIHGDVVEFARRLAKRA